ncbi:MAG: hypothetical protein IK079_01910, partial [Desulfovibrio sp.]|nr:hypothetical protein [Desulfovibrio sp.]
DLLAQAIFLADSLHLFWLETCPDATIRPLFANGSYVQKRNVARAYTLVGLGEVRSVSSFHGKAYFPEAMFAEKQLFLTVFALHAVLEASVALAPWLKVVGFSDLAFGSPPMPQSHVTLEADLRLKLGACIEINRVLTRQSQGSISFAELNPNGRKNGQSHAFLYGTTLLARTSIPHFSLQTKPYSGKKKKLIPSFSPWRLFQKLFKTGEHSWETELLLEKSLLVALGAENEYTSRLILVEGVLQAVFSCAAMIGGGQHFSLSSIGFLLFGGGEMPTTFFLSLERTFETETLQRFDASVQDENGRIVLQLAHLELLCGNRKNVDILLPALRPLEV